MIQVYEEKSKCCGCGVCSIACPKQAITMEEDNRGYLYPRIDPEKCVDCGLCAKICAHGKQDISNPKVCYAAVNTDSDQKCLSTSGGVFSAMATAFLNQGGVVCGAAMDFENGVADVRHILISSLEELPRLQGSKYVQSSFYTCCQPVMEALRQGKKVLISGTPCQIAAARSLFKKYIDQLFFVDIICHGVPSLKFFNDYLADYQTIHNFKIEKFIFRDKQHGWGLNGAILGKSAAGPVIHTLKPDESSYYRLFLDGETYRPSCYQCPYACAERVGDITIGDYWGVDRFDPQLLAGNGGTMEQREGISCLLVNTEKGEELIRQYGDILHYQQVDYGHIRIDNTQLNVPAKHSAMRQEIFDLYETKGYAAVRKKMDGIHKRKELKAKIKELLPKPVVATIKRILKKGN